MSSSKKDYRAFSNKPLPIKITVLLILIYGVLLILPNFTSSSGSLVKINLGPYLMTLIYAIVELPIVILTILFATLIWRGKRAGYLASICLLIIAAVLAWSGLLYIVKNLPEYISKDALFFFHRPPEGFNFIFDTSLENNSYTDSLLIGRYVIIKSFIKAFVEILGFFSLLKVVTGSYFQK